MRTIPHKYPGKEPFRDTQALCGYCGVQWYRSQLRGPDRSGHLSCRDCRDYEGRDVVSLNEKNNAKARRHRAPQSRRVGNVTPRGATPVHITKAEDM